MLTARSAFAGQSLQLADGGLVATDRDGLGMTGISARRGQRALLEQRLAAEFGITLPSGPRRHTAGGLAALGIGPERWLLVGEQAGNALSRTLQAAVADCAAVVDQSDAYGVIRLAGPALRNVLAKLVSVDLHPRAFRVGDVAATVLAQMGVLLWRMEDGADAQPVFEIAVSRSFAASLWHEISSHSP